MNLAVGRGELTMRQQIAARTPGWLRKIVRMALNYLYRLGMWIDLLQELEPVDWPSRRTLWLSALLAPFTALIELDSYRAPKLLSDLAVSVRGVGRFAIRADTDDLLHVMTSREPWVRHCIESHLQPGGAFVDCGANIGFYTVLAARRVGEAGRVIAFEMMPDTAQILRGHIDCIGLPQVEVIERAVCERSGDWIEASVEPGKHGQASIKADSVSGRRVVRVQTTTLDVTLSDLAQIDVLKLDLEGAEYLALLGAQAVLSRTALVIFESNDRDPRIPALLNAAGFAVEHLAGSDFVARPVARTEPKGFA